MTDIPNILIDNLFVTRNQHEACIFAFCVLPWHMHFIVQPGEKGLSAFMHSFKRNSSKDVRYVLIGAYENLPDGSTGNRTRAAENADLEQAEFTGWQRGFHDELIRDDRQLEKAVIYVQENALKHHLVENAEDWPWTSLHYEHLLGETTLSRR